MESTIQKVKTLFLFFVFLTGCSVAVCQDLIILEPALQSAIARSLGVAEKDISKSLVERSLTRLQANDLSIRDLSGLEHAKNLESLVLRDNLIDDLSPIQNLSKLNNLDLSGNRLEKLSSLAPLSGFLKQISLEPPPSSYISEKENNGLALSVKSEVSKGEQSVLRILNLSRNRLRGLSGIAHFHSLAQLDVSGNSLIDLEGVGKLKNLVNLYAQGNQLGRVESFVDRNRNKVFDNGESFSDVSGNGKREVDPLTELKNMPNLAALHLYNNRISSINELHNLPALRSLLLSGNLITSPRSLSQFKTLNILSLGNNRIHDLEGLGELLNLHRLNLSENQVCDLRILRNLTNLSSLDLSSNMLIDLHDLSGLNKIEILGVSRNLIYDPSPVLSLPKLRRITLSFNQIPLEKTSVRDVLHQAQSRGVYINTRDQIVFYPESQILVRSLIGHSSSNELLGQYLRKYGFPRLVDLILNEKLNRSDLDSSLLSWEKALKFDKPLSSVLFSKE